MALDPPEQRLDYGPISKSHRVSPGCVGICPFHPASFFQIFRDFSNMARVGSTVRALGPAIVSSSLETHLQVKLATACGHIPSITGSKPKMLNTETWDSHPR